MPSRHDTVIVSRHFVLFRKKFVECFLGILYKAQWQCIKLETFLVCYTALLSWQLWPCGIRKHRWLLIVCECLLLQHPGWNIDLVSITFTCLSRYLNSLHVMIQPLSYGLEDFAKSRSELSFEDICWDLGKPLFWYLPYLPCDYDCFCSVCESIPVITRFIEQG